MCEQIDSIFEIWWESVLILWSVHVERSPHCHLRRNLHHHFQEATENFLLFSGVWLQMILFYFISPVTIIVMHLRSFSSGGHYQIFQLELELVAVSVHLVWCLSSQCIHLSRCLYRSHNPWCHSSRRMEVLNHGLLLIRTHMVRWQLQCLPVQILVCDSVSLTFSIVYHDMSKNALYIVVKSDCNSILIIVQL